MISGQFDSQGQLFFEVGLIDSDGLVLPVDALLDTGSTEWLAINAQDLESLGWSIYGTRDIQTARGNMAFSTYLGRVLLDGQEFTVPVVAGAAFQEILLHAVG